jgi:predicted nucleotide-binding protein (sugar kinase/HSP70/actin superfamily)
MQRSLYTFQTGVLWVHFFFRLGFRVVLTPPTNSRIASAGIETMTSETCFPVKVSHGHVKAIVGKTKYLFLPSIINMQTPEESEKGSYCPLVSANPFMLRMALELDRETVLRPIVHLKYGSSTLSMELSKHLSKKLGRSRSEIKGALEYALGRQDRFVREVHRRGKEIFSAHTPVNPLVVVTGRPYNLYDQRLNLRLGQNMAKIGMEGIPMDFIDVGAVDFSDFPTMYWGLGAGILRTAKFIKDHSHVFGLHITNFSCGPDSFVEHFYRHVMGDKPYLILELDEHSAVAGVMTRLEAYKNVIENAMKKLETECSIVRTA